MKQPELGKKIFELRKSKRLTQEELVEKCNVSIRTIQRIETGVVTPRSYTLKTILAALDYDLDLIPDEKHTASTWLRNLLLIDSNKSNSFLIKQLNISWIFGICYFILRFFEGVAESFRFMDPMKEHFNFLDPIIFNKGTYALIKLGIVLSFFLFQRGFILIGGLFKNYLLKMISMVLISASILIIGLDLVSLFFNFIEPEFILLAYAITFGATGIIYGIALNRLQNPIGKTAKFAGLFEIIAACFSLTVVFSFMGPFILIPAELLEIIIVFKTIEIIRAREINTSSDVTDELL